MVKYQTKRSFYLISACSLGTILEWYDFTLYAYLTPIISIHFFPKENQTVSLMLAYSVFAIGFIVRPIGAVLFGHFGDRIGRKKVLVISMILMGSMTCLIGLLPTYHQIGIVAPVLLILLRIFQGLSIGGETVGAGSLVMESTQDIKRGFSTSIVWASSGIGILLSSMIISILTGIFAEKTFSEWAWRIPFLLGSATGIVGYYLRKNMPESTIFRSIYERKQTVRIPLYEAIKSFKKEMMIAISLYILCSITIYLLFVFMPIYAFKTIGLPFNQAVTINTLAMVCMVLLVPLVGRYSDYVGRKVILFTSALGFLVLSFPLLQLISKGSLLGLGFAQIIFAILTAGFHGPITSAVLEMFPPAVRYSAAAFGYNISYSLFGSTIPIISIYLVNKFETYSAPSFCLIFGSIIAIIALATMKETYKNQLH